LIFPEHFYSLTDCIFQVKFRRWLSGLLNHTLDSDIKVLNHVLLALASDHDKQKSKPNTNFLLKINWLNQLIMKLVCLMQHRRRYEAKIVMKIRVLQLKCINSTMSGNLSFCDSFMIPVTTLCIVMFAEKQAQIYYRQNRICYRKLKV
jgi:hypothetical protein